MLTSLFLCLLISTNRFISFSWMMRQSSGGEDNSGHIDDEHEADECKGILLAPMGRHFQEELILRQPHNDGEADGDEEEVEVDLNTLHLIPGSKEEDGGPEGSLFVSAMSNIGVQYNYSNISLALAFLEEGYPQTGLGWDVESVLKTVVFSGSIFGMLSMGSLGDLIGRNRALVVTSLLAGIGALGSSIAARGGPNQLYLGIGICRFVIGVGLGGVYPLTGKGTESHVSNTDMPFGLLISFVDYLTAAFSAC